MKYITVFDVHSLERTEGEIGFQFPFLVGVQLQLSPVAACREPANKNEFFHRALHIT
jgi:hypothetical protein